MVPPMSIHSELICRSAFSFHEGTCLPEDLIDQAAALRITHLAITDRDAVYGLPRAHKRVKQRRTEGLCSPRLICGALVTIQDGPGMALLVRNAQGWTHLCRLLTQARCHESLAEANVKHPRKGWGNLPIQSILEQAQGLEAILVGEWSLQQAGLIREAFGPYSSIALCPRLDGRDAIQRKYVQSLSTQSGIPVVGSANVLMSRPNRKPLQDVLSCIRLKLSIEEAGRILEPNASRHLCSPSEMKRRFWDQPQAILRSAEIASRCLFSLDELKYLYPKELVPEKHTPISWLRHLTTQGLQRRYPNGVPQSVIRQVEHELNLIERLNFPAYFLTVADTVRFARSRGILCQGRGSAANSAVCFALGITSVDPAKSSLLFERFISEERGEPPDIDVDFEHERREEVIQYIYQRYGRHRAAMVNEVISYRKRSAIRAVGKVMGLSTDQIDQIAQNTHYFDPKRPRSESLKEIGLDPTQSRLLHTLHLVEQIQGLPRHVGIHVGGFTISDTALIDLCPIEPATMKQRTVIQWDKDDIDIVGFVKVDLLSLGMLTAIRKALSLISNHWSINLDLASIPAEDPKVYDMLCKADSVGVFQVESRAQMSMLPRLQPRCWYDLVIQVSIVRPGPIQGGMVHPYLQRRRGQKPISYAHPKLRPILERTAGVPIFQEQVMAMAVVVGGFSPGQADQLRRSMSAWRKKGGLEPLTQRLRSGMQANGISPQYADQICAQIRGFGEYGFPESHAASFARLVYISAWLKCHYPAAFTVALLNSQPMGFYSARSLIADAKRHGVEVHPICVQHSQWDSSLEPSTLEHSSPTPRPRWAIRLGLRQIKGMRQEHADALRHARHHHNFTDLNDFARRSKLPRSALALLAESGALSCLENNRRQARWALQGTFDLPLFRGLVPDTDPTAIRPPTAEEELKSDFQSTGLSIHHDPVAMLRPLLTSRGVLTAAQVMTTQSNTLVRVAGIISHRQRPKTASGIIFMTLEDETGMLNLVVKPNLFQRQRSLILGRNMLQMTARVQRDGLSISLLCLSFRPIQDEDSVQPTSRDFR